MKIAVIGPGALGCLFSALLGRLNDVWLVDRDPDRARFIQSQGLVLDENGQNQTVRVNVTSDVSIVPQVELVLLCVKSASVKDAVISSMPVIRNGRPPLVVALQNGIGHLGVLKELLSGSWALGVTAQGATLAGSGMVLHRGNGPTRIGFPDPLNKPDDEELLGRSAFVLSESGIPTETSGDIQKHIWNKLLINVGINALTAIYRCPNGMLLESEDVLHTMKRAVLEGETVAKSLGIKIDEDPVGRAIEVCRATSANISSMLQDVRKKKKTEIDAINGELVRKGHEIGADVSANEELVRKVREIEKDFH